VELLLKSRSEQSMKSKVFHVADTPVRLVGLMQMAMENSVSPFAVGKSQVMLNRFESMQVVESLLDQIQSANTPKAKQSFSQCETR
jgi:hypothetical protein